MSHMTMTRDQELWACALLLEREHGKGAFLYATMQIDAMDAAGDVEGGKVWRTALERIDALQAKVEPN